MPRYTFTLYGDRGGFLDDTEGSELATDQAAQEMAAQVARDLTRNGGFLDQNWTLVTYNGCGKEIGRTSLTEVARPQLRIVSSDRAQD
jgi:hypothetical protein